MPWTIRFSNFHRRKKNQRIRDQKSDGSFRWESC
jgi:hypothetical protein